VDARGLVDYVQQEVPKQTANIQHPMANPDFVPTLPLAFLDRPGPSEKPAESRTTLLLLNAGRTRYSRVEWTDSVTQVTAVRPLSRDANDAMITAIPPGEIELRFYDAQNQLRRVSVQLLPGLNTLDLLTRDISRFRPADPIQLAALQPILPQVPAASQQVPEENEAILTITLGAPADIYVDGVLWAQNRSTERQLQLRGLTPGIHNLRLVPNPDREFRFRVRLFPGTQKFDPQSGELLFVGRPRASVLELPSLQDVPVILQLPYQRFALALQEERLIQPAGDSAWDYYVQIRDTSPPELRESMTRRLIVAMADRAQRTILKYLQGGDIRWNAEIFSQAATLLERTQQLFRQGSVFESQKVFLNGRAMIERGQYAQAVDQLRRAVTLDPQASYAYNAIGLAFWKQNLLGQAIPELEQAISLTPQWNYPRNTLALIYLEQRRLTECEEALESSLQADPEDSTAYHALAQLDLLLGRPQDAESQLQRAIEFNPGNAYAYETYGKLYQSRRAFQQAETAFRLAIRLEPDEPSFRASLGELLRETGRIAQAQAAFEQLARNFPADLRVVKGYASLLKEQNRIGEAKRLFERAVKAAPSDVNLRIAFAVFMRQSGRIKDARKQAEAASQLVPNNASAHYELAAALLAQRQTAKAETELARAIATDSRLATPRQLLGQIRFSEKRYSEALEQYRAALKISIDTDQKQELQQLIDEAETKLVEVQIVEAARNVEQRDYVKAWATYTKVLASNPGNRALRAAVLAFVEQHPEQSAVAELPQPLSQILGSSFWKAQQHAEMLWAQSSVDEAAGVFSQALMNIDTQERRLLIAGTNFNLGNDSYSVHQIAYRWARRLLDLGRYRAALELMEQSVEQNIFAAVPNFSPLTIDSLMIPESSVAIPSSFAGYEVAQHPDWRAHVIYAASYSGLGDLARAREYLTALAGLPMELPAANIVAEVLRGQQKSNEALALLQESLSRRAPNAGREATIQAYTLTAEIQAEAGNRSAAKTTLEVARKLVPKDKQIDAARRKLKL